MNGERRPSYDVFLSHNSADKALVERVAARLQDEAGLAPFLDKWHLVPGEPWQEALENALDESSTCAVFLGPSGLGSWENEEMRAALDDRIRNRRFRVVPVLLPGADPKDPKVLPRFLRRVTWVDFRSGIEDDEAFRRLVAGIRGEAPGRGRGSSVSEPPKTGVAQHLVRFLRTPAVLLVLPSLLLAGVTLILQNWRVPTRIDVSLCADRARFTVGGDEAAQILNTLGFRSITIEKFTRIAFSPAKLEAADPSGYLPGEDRFHPSAWRQVLASSPCVVTPLSESLIPAVTLEGDGPAASSGILDRLRAEPGSEVTLEVRDTGRALTVQLEGKQPAAFVSFRGSFQMITRAAALDGVEGQSGQTGSTTYRASPADGRPEIELAGRPAAMTLVVALSPEESQNLFPRGSIPVTALDFTRQEETGRRVSALVSGGEIGYPDFPSIRRAVFKAPDLISLDQLDGFRIEEIGLDPANCGLRFRMKGIAGEIRTGTQEFATDHRLTLVDKLLAYPVTVAILGIVAWMLPTMAAGVKLYRELRAQRL
jgi:hypothetical protein